MAVLTLGEDTALAALDPPTKQEIQQAVDEYLAKKRAEEGVLDKLLPTLKGGKLRLSGELEYEYKDVENDEDTDEPEPHLALDKFALYPRVYLKDNIYLDMQLYFQPHKKTYINEFHIMFKNTSCPVNSYIDLGLFERQIKDHSHRDSEGYPLIGTAFWRDDEYAVRMGGEWSFLYWSFLVGDGLELGEKQTAEDSSYKIIHDDRKEDSFTGLSEVVANLGYRNDYGDLGKVDLLLFYVYKELSDEDVDFLRAIPGYGSSGYDNGYRCGLGADYRIMGLRLYGQYITAEDGWLKRSGWYIQPSYKLKLEQAEYFKACEILFRYGKLDVDLWPDPSNSYTWNREKITLALITDVYENIKLKTEYYINNEDTGDEDVDNDELLVQLEVKF
jgi:hypothetical protein